MAELSHSAPPAGRGPRRRLISRHRLFLVGIALKGIDGVVELIAGSALFFLTIGTINRFLLLLVSGELQEDPNDLVANSIVHFGLHLSVSSKTFAAIYLVGHGALKLFLVISLWRNKRWAYPTALIFLTGFIGYQIYRFLQHHSMMLALFTLMDIAIVALIGSEYRHRPPGHRRFAS